ncbi:MAG: hypothetical protein WBD43_03085 [Methylovirgula sp.]
MTNSSLFVHTFGALNARFAEPKEISMAKKERIIPPKKSTGSKASPALKKGSTVAARVMADLSVAKRQHAKRPRGK